MSELKNKKAVVVGLAKSGIAAIHFLARQGARVVANDLKPAIELKESLVRLQGLPVEIVLGSHPENVFLSADLIVISPGVPQNLLSLVKAREQGVSVVSELEFAARELQIPLIAVTGTNGKSTTVSLIGEIMKRDRGTAQVFVGGNLGTPLTELLLAPDGVELAVVEVSSFQLEFVDAFHPRVAVMLNLSPDHLDRYRDFQDYAETKWRVFRRQTADDFAVVNLDDPTAAAMSKGMKPRLMTISLDQAPAFGMWRRGEVLEFRGEAATVEELLLSEIPLAGTHNLENVMAAVCAARAMGAPMTAVREAVRGFKTLAHRLALVRERGGVRFYNDSKATNVGAVEADVRGLTEPLILLMGGQAKGCSFSELAGKIAPRVKLVMAFGESRHQLQREMGDRLAVTVVADLREALAGAAAAAKPGDAVLLAPACASFDQFKDYKDRGETFARLVGELS